MTRLNSRTEGRGMHTLQLGAHWFPEQPGGLERYYYELLRELPAVGVCCRGLVIASAPPRTDQATPVHAAASGAAPLWTRWRAVRRLVRRSLAEHPVDVVASHFALYAAPTLDLLDSRPLVVHFQGPWALESKLQGAHWGTVKIKQALERRVYRSATLLLTLSRQFAELLARVYGIPEERIRTVPGAVRVDNFALTETREAARDILGWPRGRPIVLTVRRLVPRMGLPELLEAVRRLRTSLPDVLVCIAGAGPLAPQLARLAADLDGRVLLLGRLSEEKLRLAYRAADLGLVPSTALEGFGLVVVESLAAGTPVLVTPVGGLPEVVAGLGPDLVLGDSRPETLADGLELALRGRIRLPSAEACQAFVRERYDWPIIAARVGAVYQEALSLGRQGA